MANNAKGEPLLIAEALARATTALAMSLANVGIKPPLAVLTAAARVTVREYIKAEPKQRAQAKRKVLPSTLALTNMAIGESIYDSPPLHTTSYYSRFKTARKLMDNPEAMWRVDQEPDNNRARITRLNDGADGRTLKPPTLNPKAVYLANIPVGLVRELPLDLWPLVTVNYGRGKRKQDQHINTGEKHMARRLLDNSGADWRMIKMSTGNKVKRIK